MFYLKTNDAISKLTCERHDVFGDSQREAG